MEISSSTLDSLAAQTSAQDERAVLVLKKALDAQAQGVLSLIQALPQPPSSSNLPPNIGRNINTTA